MINRKRRRQRQRLMRVRRRTNQKTERPKAMRLRKLRRRSLKQRRRSLKLSSAPPIHPFFFFPIVCCLSFLSCPSFRPSPPLPSSAGSKPLKDPSIHNCHQKNIFINNFVNTGSGF